MNDWFEWNNVRCTTVGIHVLEQPPVTMAQERVTFTDIPGRSGSLTISEGTDVYDDIVLTAECMIDGNADINAVTAFLKGGGTVIFANRPDGFYHARINNQIPFEKILRGNSHRSFSVNFRCKPFWYLKNIPDITLTSSAGTIQNPGNVIALPTMTVNGTGDITLTVNTQIIELSDLNGSVTLNSELQEAYVGTTSANNLMDGDFPVLNPGSNTYSWSGSVTSIIISPGWRYL